MNAFKLVLLFLFIIVVIGFAFENAAPVDISFYFSTFQTSLALVIFICLALGTLLGIIVSLPANFKRSREISSLKKRLKALEMNRIQHLDEDGEDDD